MLRNSFCASKILVDLARDEWNLCCCGRVEVSCFRDAPSCTSLSRLVSPMDGLRDLSVFVEFSSHIHCMAQESKALRSKQTSAPSLSSPLDLQRASECHFLSVTVCTHFDQSEVKHVVTPSVFLSICLESAPMTSIPSVAHVRSATLQLVPRTRTTSPSLCARRRPRATLSVHTHTPVAAIYTASFTRARGRSSCRHHPRVARRSRCCLCSSRASRSRAS